jgi:hypothetical protein
MASYGTFISVCGFDYDGPKEKIRFAPKMNPEKCKLPFTAATAWGSYEQASTKKVFTASLKIEYGILQLKTFSFDAIVEDSTVTTMLDGRRIQSTISKQDNTYLISFPHRIDIKKGQTLHIKLD